MAKKEIVLFRMQDPKVQSAFVRADEFILISNIKDNHTIGVELTDGKKILVFKLHENKYYPHWIGDNVYAREENDRCSFNSVKELLTNLSNIEGAYAFDEPRELMQWLITNNYA